MKSSVTKVLFRLDSGGQFGLGHIMRSKALADAFVKIEQDGARIESTFAVKKIHAIQDVIPHQLIFLDTEEEFVCLANFYDIIIIDHYDYTTDLFLQLSTIKKSILVVLDDECNRGNLYADIVVNPGINPTVNALAQEYKKVAAKAKLLLGAEYVLLRAFFNQLENQPLEQRQSIIITFGGSDITRLTIPVLKAIKNSILKKHTIIVVTADGYQHLDEIKKFCFQQHFIHKHNVENMAALFSTAKFAISAAGSTVFELACCGVPAVFAVVADNQFISVKEQSKYGWCSVIDCREKNKADELVLTAEKMIIQLPLQQLSQTASSLIDGKGAERVARFIQTELLTYKQQ